MAQDGNNKVRIKDIAEELGVSTATVSNVINGKTKKISDETVKRVQNLLEERKYVPNMAAVLLSQNSSRIVCVVISDHDKYENNLLQDPFVSALMDSLSNEIEDSGYFMMIKKTANINEIQKYASMWNMAGLVLIGFCEQDYDDLRQHMRIPFVVMDGFFESLNRFANIGIDNFQGGYQMGCYLISKGHRKIMFVSDNDLCMDHDRFMGLKKALADNCIDESNAKLEIIPMIKSERVCAFEAIKNKLSSFTAIFCASDMYAIEIMNYLIDSGFQIPKDISIVGFDDIPSASIVRPRLTTIHQDIPTRAKLAMEMLRKQIDGNLSEKDVVLEVSLVERDSVRINN